MQESKIVIIGNGSIGKTSFVKKIMYGEFWDNYSATLGVEVFPVVHNNKQFTLWDCAGEEKFGGLRDGYWLGSNCAIIMVSDEKKSIEFWYKQISKFVSDDKIVIFNNGSTKFDKFLIEHPDIKYFEADVKTDTVENLKSVFELF